MLAYGVANDDAQVQQHPLPDSWRFVLVTPPGRVGLSGAAEQSTFQSARPLASAEAASLLRLVRNDWWPAVVRADFDAFSSALEEFGRRVGEYFAPQQGGVFADPMMATLAQQLGAAGVAGVAQTSWGPTIAIACRDADHAQELEHQIRADERWASCAVHITAALNRGATVRVW
jgi:predicted sugar kinase